MARALSDWIQSYLEYTDNQESPVTYHFWTGMTVMAAALQRRVRLRRVKYWLYPNLYVILIAESGKTRKSIPLEIGMQLLAEAVPDLYIISDSATPEGIIRYMNRSVMSTNGDGKRVLSQESHLMLYADELASLFGYEKGRASRLTILLTRGYGSPSDYRHTTVKDSMIHLYNVYFNLLAATARENLKVIPQEASGGLIGRLILISEREKRRSIAWEDAIDDSSLRERLVADLYRISQLQGEFTVEPEARAFFEEWYNRQAGVSFNDPNMDAFHSRCHDTALKLACLLCVSRGDDLVLRQSHVAAGIAFVEEQLPEFSRIVAWAGDTDFSRNRAKLIELLTRAGGIAPRRAMLRQVGIAAPDFAILIETLVQDGTIKVTKLAGIDQALTLLGDGPIT